jgi:UDP:flavonoid glycosyltransferase YjiC (YdhE family)
MRIAVVSGPDPGHLLPAVAFGREAAGRGHDVTIMTTSRWKADVEATGLDHRSLPGVSKEPTGSDLGWRMWGRAAGMAPHVAESLAVSRPDLVVADTLTAGGGFGAEVLGIPWVELVPHWLWAPSDALPPIGLGQRAARTPIGRLLERVQRRQQARSFAEGRDQRRRARASIGLPVNGGPALRILATLPALELPRPDWPARCFIVGLLEWEPSSWEPLDPPDGDEPLVVVTDSTASGIDVSLGGRFVVGLHGDRIRLAVTTTRAVPDRPATVAGRGGHGPLLDVADCAAGFAGHGFVSKALARGVPLVLVPLQGDQRETAARVERLGAGITVPLEKATPSALAAAVSAVLADPSYRQAAARVASSGRGLGAARAVGLAERFTGA